MTHWRSIQALRGLVAQEIGVIVKDWGGRIPIALAYPNTYYVGMSALGLHTLYRLLNARDNLVAERVFWDEKASGPTLSLESQRPMSDFAFVAFSVPYELDYFHIALMLRHAGIPLRADQRDEGDPIILMGGPAVTANPLPLAPFADAIYIGEVESLLEPMVEALQARTERNRDETLQALSRVPGFYVPAHPRLPVARQWLRDVDAFPTHSVVLTRRTEFGDMYLIEIARGCGRGCRFCLAGYVYRPMRERSLETVLAQAREGLAHRRKIGLVSAAVSDYSQRDELVARLRKLGAKLSVSSLRADSLSPTLLQALTDSGTRTLTFAPEAGSDRLRRVINKNISEEQIIAAATLAGKARFPELKLYFMFGLPTETEHDIDELCRLTQAIARAFGGKVTVNLSPFVPKAHTPFARAPMLPAEELKRRLATIQARLRPAGISAKTDSVAWARVQGVLARGGEELAHVIAGMDVVSLPAWHKALAARGLSEEAYLEPAPLARALPWEGVIASGVSDAYLAQEQRAAEQAQTSAACPPSGCTRCGVCP